MYGELDARVLGHLETEGIAAADSTLSREIDVRYFGQSEGFTVSVPAGVLDDRVLATITSGFLEQQQREFGYVMPENFATIELVTARVSGVGLVEKVQLEPIAPGSGAESAVMDLRDVHFNGRAIETKVYSRAQLGAGDEFVGAAIVEQDDSTTVVPPDARARVDEYGDLVIDLTGDGS